MHGGVNGRIATLPGRGCLSQRRPGQHGDINTHKAAAAAVVQPDMPKLVSILALLIGIVMAVGLHRWRPAPLPPPVLQSRSNPAVTIGQNGSAAAEKSPA